MKNIINMLHYLTKKEIIIKSETENVLSFYIKDEDMFKLFLQMVNHYNELNFLLDKVIYIKDGNDTYINIFKKFNIDNDIKFFTNINNVLRKYEVYINESIRINNG